MPVLFEYGSVYLDLSRSQAEALNRSGFVDVAPAEGDRWRVTASSYVGSLVVDGVELLIRPKINPENLFLLLEPGLPPGAWRKEAFNYDASSDLLPSVIAFFARTVDTTLGRGVLRSYQAREESLTALRGRMDVAGQFKRAGLLTPIASKYDDFTEDIVENRVLRAAIRAALRVPRGGARRTPATECGNWHHWKQLPTFRSASRRSTAFTSLDSTSTMHRLWALLAWCWRTSL